MLGFALCFVCLAATTWAWFTASVTSGMQTIQTASFGVEVYLDGSTTPATADANGSYALATGTHTIKLKPTGNATKGFAVVTIAPQTSSQMLMLASAGSEQQQATPTDIEEAGTYYTQQLFDENGVAQIATFTIQATGDVTLTVKAYWGEKQTDLVATPITATLTPLSNEAQLTNEEEDPVDETQQEEEQKNQQEEEENPSDENNPADDPENNGEGENTSTDTPAEGEGGQQGDEQQPSEPSTPTDGEQGGEQPTGEPSNTPDGENGQQGGETSETPDVSEKTSDENNEGGNTEENPSSEEPTEQLTEQDA